MNNNAEAGLVLAARKRMPNTPLTVQPIWPASPMWQQFGSPVVFLRWQAREHFQIGIPAM